MKMATRVLATRKLKPVNILSFMLDTSPDVKIPEFRVFFDMDTWDTKTQGGLHGDKIFLMGVVDYFRNTLMFDIEMGDLTYGKKANQGLNFVAFDVSMQFVHEMVGFMRAVSKSVNPVKESVE